MIVSENHIKIYQTETSFHFKKIEVNKKQIFTSETIIYSGNCISAPISYILGKFSECKICLN